MNAAHTAIVTRDSDSVLIRSAYEVECAGFVFHVQKLGSTWQIDGRDRAGLSSSSYADACSLIAANDGKIEHRTLRAAVAEIERICA